MPPSNYNESKKTTYDVWQENKFELIFDSDLANEEDGNDPVLIEIEEKDSESECQQQYRNDK